MCDLSLRPLFTPFFFFNDTATTEIYTLSLHDALPISRTEPDRAMEVTVRMDGTRSFKALVRIDTPQEARYYVNGGILPDRKSTRLNSSHLVISYAVFCLKKKKKKRNRYAVTSTKSRAS